MYPSLIAFVIVAFCLSAGPLPLLAQEPGEQAREHFLAARHAQDAGQFELAEHEYMAVIHLEPGIAEGYASLGQLYFAEGKLADAARALATANRLKPGLPGVSLNAGTSYLKLGQAGQAIPYLREAVRLDPKNSQTQILLSTALWNAGKKEESLGQIRKAKQSFSSDPDVLFLAAEAYRKAADRELEKLLSKVNGTPLGHQVYGDVYLAQQAWDKAAGHYYRAAEQDPRWIGAYIGLGRVALYKGDWDEAERMFRRAVQVEPASAAANARLAEVALLKGNAEEARALLTAAIRTSPEEAASELGLPPSFATVDEKLSKEARQQLSSVLPSLRLAPAGPAQNLAIAFVNTQMEDEESFRVAWHEFRAGVHTAPRMISYKRALLSYQKQSFEDAEAELHSWLAANPGDQSAHYLLARSYRALSLFAEDRLLSTNPDAYQTHKLLAQAFENKGDNEKALSEYRIVERISSGLPGIHLAIGRLLNAAGDTDGAVAELTEELHRNPADADANAELGALLLARNETERAIEHLARAVRSEPDFWVAHRELGKAYAMQKEYAKAERELAQAIPGDSDGSVHYQLGMVYKALGRAQAASEAFADARKIKAQRLSEATLSIREKPAL